MLYEKSKLQKNHNATMTSPPHAGRSSFSKWYITVFSVFPWYYPQHEQNHHHNLQWTLMCNCIFQNSVYLPTDLAIRFPLWCLCSSKFIFPSHYWSAGRQGLWSWQPSLSDLGVDQEPVWAQGPGWIYRYMRAVLCFTLDFLIKSSILEGVMKWDTVLL